eukprot:6586367-Prorocentrum_lima.AAC.1
MRVANTRASAPQRWPCHSAPARSVRGARGRGHCCWCCGAFVVETGLAVLCVHHHQGACRCSAR